VKTLNNMGILATALMGIFFLPSAISHGPLVLATTTPATPEASADAGDVPLSPSTLTVNLTAYNAVPDQTDSTPFETASGAYSNPQVVAARSRDLARALPFGTIIAIEAPRGNQSTCGYAKVQKIIGYRVIADSMNPRMHDRVDILLNQNDTVRLTPHGKPINPSIALGICHHVTIRIVGHVAIRNIPRTQKDLALLVSGDTKTNSLALR